MNEGELVGVVGLGRMGLALCENLRDKGHRVLGYDLCEENRALLVSRGMTAAASIEALCGRLAPPRRIIMMVPAGAPVDAVVAVMLPLLAPGDVVIDAGNSHYRDSVRREALLFRHGVGFLDVGTSGGISGARHGACLTVGGVRALFEEIEPLFRDIAQENGYLYVGPSGWGHLVKTVHNGIEYGFLQAIGEGLNTIREVADREGVAVDLAQLCSVWNNGSIIASRLMGDASQAMRLLEEHPEIAGTVGGGETGGWAQEIARGAEVCVPVLDAALAFRKRSQQAPDFTGRVIAAVRYLFGGHGFA